ncbi:hypothetical protein OG337_35295 [[Kitasatospora] papulosa]|uniref:hypothetical protein n=2 Tax=Streptomyces TaxID=1883 RepID=UPI0018FE5878|nr:MULTISPECIES: hypothetical protein [Streptomyces]MCY1655546.1 hypothetical protein [Streptomyces sp. SL203]WSZ52311.1 hypothetical protein OG337_35295 [[Kitasatospora] papulosa]
MFIFGPVNHGAQRFRELGFCQHPTVFRESAMTVAIVLLAGAVVLVVALLSATGAGVLARIDGETWPTACTRAAGTFAAVLALAAAVTAALSPFFT